MSTRMDREWKQALKQVGQTPVEQARWLISLAYKPGLDQLTSDERFARQMEMTVFFNNYQEASPITTPLSEDVRHLEKRVRSLLRSVVKDSGSHVLKVTHAYRVEILPTGEWNLMRAMDRLDQGERLSLRLYKTLAAVEGRIRVCRKRGCNRLFVRTKGQLYCSPKHAQLDRTNKFRGKPWGVVDTSPRSA